MSKLNISHLVKLFKQYLCLFAITLALSAFSVNSVNAENTKQLLILNSYHEDELWGNDVTKLLVQHVMHINELEYTIMYLNSSTVTDSLVYNELCNNVFDAYKETHPDYVVMVGNFAFNFRDRIKEEWGEVPMLLISRSEGYGPLEDYFANYDPTTPIENRTPLSEARDKYNFTAIIVPDYCKQNIDLMIDIIPDMEELVFLSDVSYVNRIAAYRIYNYLIDEYPMIKFKWLMSNEANSEQFRSYMINRNPKLGLLMSSWCYSTTSTLGFPVLTTKDLNMIQSAVNPVFSLHRAYMAYNVLGGVYTDDEKIQKHIVSVVDSMMLGASMHDIPFFIPEKYTTIVNYDKLKNLGLSDSRCPKDTIFLYKPQTLWEKYGILLLTLAILAVLLFVLLWKQNGDQRKKIDVLNRLSHFIDGMPIPYTVVDVTIKDDKELVSVKFGDNNQALNNLISYSKINESIMQKLPSNTLLTRTLDLEKNGKSVSFIYHVDESDSYFDVLFQLVEIANLGNKTKRIRFDVFIRDITARQRTQTEMNNAATILNMAMDITKLIPWQLDLKTYTLRTDGYNSFMKRANVGEHDGAEQNFKDYMSRVHPDDRKIIDTILLKVAKKEINDFIIQYRMERSDDHSQYDWIENRGAITAYDDNDVPTKLTGTVQLITDRKEHEAQMAEALIKANESDRMKSAFLANMSHEIRTPLNAIVGFSSMMVKTNDEDKRAELASVINRNNDLLLNLINDVLDLAKIESNTIELDKNICDVNDMLDSLGKTISIRIPKGVLLNIVHYSDKCIVETDSSRLAQILINFLTNACKCTSKGSITLGYEILESDNMLYFYVRDTGKGIALDNQSKIFQQFVKLDQFAQGTGLGLAICRSLVERMGGKIGVESAGEGRGAKFWFTLPYVPVVLEEVAEEIEAEKEKNPEVKPLVDFSIINKDENNNKMTILVAEDNDSNYWLIEQMLGDNYNMVHAENGRLAVELYSQVHPDLIIMDINMPEMDGYEAVREIRKLSDSVPIIAVTAYAFASDRIRILNSGFNAYVSKPISEISIFDAINTVLRRK